MRLIDATSTVRRAWWVASIAVVAATVISRWPFRSHALFTWDSANFALGMARIDIAQHRPHPPGYLGYVLVARAIDLVVHDANAALVLWNIFATALAALVIARFVWEITEPGKRTRASTAAAAILLTSPAVWFYSEIAEIYASELLFASLVAYAAWRAARGEDRALYWSVAALAMAAAFKVVTAILMAPVVLFAWTRVSAPTRRLTAALGVIALVAGAAAWLLVQPDLVSAVWRFAASSRWLFRGDADHPMRMLNRNVRDTLLAALVGLGALNFVILLWWMVRDRRLPAGLNGRFATLWLLPGLFVFVFVIIAKPGYVMPLVPLGVIVVSGFYARLRPAIGIALIAMQACVNVGHFTLLTPAAFVDESGDGSYASKTFVQRMAADLTGVSETTAFTIRRSDTRLHALLDLVARTCPGGAPVIVAGVDWRRVMWYLPEATAIQLAGGRVIATGRHTDASPLAPNGEELLTSCPIIWLASGEGADGVDRPPDATETVPHVGWLTGPGTLRVTRDGVEAVR
jgi:hypothetical protein